MKNPFKDMTEEEKEQIKKELVRNAQKIVVGVAVSVTISLISHAIVESVEGHFHKEDESEAEESVD